MSGKPTSDHGRWIVCQIGAREHYAIPRALHQAGRLEGVLTDFWVPPGHLFGRMPAARRLRDRYHPGLAGARVDAPNLKMLGFELEQRVRRRGGWPLVMARNRFFQRQVIASLGKGDLGGDGPVTLFSYSYAALDLFRHAKERGWRTVLGQIDPGPEEERLVAEEHRRYPGLKSSWQAVPPTYWSQWREEVALADRIIVNSGWSRDCLLKEGVSEEKMEVVPLVYQDAGCRGSEVPRDPAAPLQVLFLGQVILRKGIGRLLEAMRLLRDEPIELVLAGPSELDPSAWADLPKVRWVGPVPRGEVGRLYEEADLFILPTLSDGYAITQLEALARGLPVIASAHCGAAAVHGASGWILANLEPETIRDQLSESARSRHRLVAASPPDFGLAELAAALIGGGSGGDAIR